MSKGSGTRRRRRNGWRKANSENASDAGPSSSSFTPRFPLRRDVVELEVLPLLHRRPQAPLAVVGILAVQRGCRDDELQSVAPLLLARCGRGIADVRSGDRPRRPRRLTEATPGGPPDTPAVSTRGVERRRRAHLRQAGSSRADYRRNSAAIRHAAKRSCSATRYSGAVKERRRGRNRFRVRVNASRKR